MAKRSKAKKPAPKSKAAAPKDPFIPARDALPFFRKGGRAFGRWWNVTPTGDYRTDTDMGRIYARATLPLLQFDNGPSALCWIIKGMFEALGSRRGKEKWSGIESGFLWGLAEYLISALSVSMIVREATVHSKGLEIEGGAFLKILHLIEDLPKLETTG